MTRPTPMTTPSQSRASWHRRVGLVPLTYLAAIIVVAFVHPFLAEGVWFLVHLLLLGAATNAILIWSSHFSDAVLRTRADSKRGETTRLAVLNAGVLAVLAAGILSQAWVGVGGATLVFAAALGHLVSLAVRLRRALPARFGMTVHFYLAATAALLVGIPLGALMLVDHSSEWHERVLLVHVHVNLFGWIAMTVLGTLVTLWPTVLRTRIADGAERAAVRAWWLGSAGLVALTVALLAWWPVLAVGAVILLLAATVLIGIPGFSAARRRTPSSFAAWSMAAAVGWLIAALGYDGVLLATADGPSGMEDRLGALLVPLLVGFVAQVLLGALSYLIPVVLGGGPTRARDNTAVMERHWPQRVATANAALALYVLPVPSYVRITASLLLLVVLIQFLIPAARLLLSNRRSS